MAIYPLVDAGGAVAADGDRGVTSVQPPLMPGIPTTAGQAYPTNNPDYSGIFIPTIWAGKLLEKFYASTVLAAIANTDWAGEITNQGDKVIIRTKPTITIRAYQANQDLEIERPTSSVVELQIDKGYYFNTALDDVFETQADLNLLGMWADDASEQLKIVIDTEVLAYVPTEVAATTNEGGGAGAISADIDLGGDGALGTGAAYTPGTNCLGIVPRAPAQTNGSEIEVIDAIVRLGQTLDEQNIPETGRWIVVPAWFAAMIKRSELRDASLTGDGVTMLRNGRLGMIERFTVYMSNLLDVDGTNGYTNILAGHSHGLTFASQLTEMETLRSERTFSNVMRGLQVYGRKVVDGRSLALLRAAPGPVAAS